MRYALGTIVNIEQNGIKSRFWRGHETCHIAEVKPAARLLQRVARALAERLHPNVDIISSLAGRVPDPALPVGSVRIGGFGGVEGLRTWLTENAVAAQEIYDRDFEAPLASALVGRIRATPQLES